MSELKEKIEGVIKMIMPIVKESLGKDVNFIFIPVVDGKDKTEVAVVSDLEPKKLCLHLGMAAQHTIESLGGIDENCLCDKCKARKEGKNVVPINKDLH